ncbi:ABC transporter ATP-binding protein [Shinella sp. PSBB067]|uniref:ABC transporter ATP-binding protein n=1 Tax=Shinella sp. PSBB067 TaxID=2715959 RepID=UPI00193BDF11|nr:ABC transporter ATP-binding protein [Shinella sp. PSBB067]QRI63476.1 ABC transporter ATP-binding protein [Shinella sp. PSBB067]
MTDRPVLEAVGVARMAGGRPIVSGIDLGVRAGETLGLIGPNGSGKSTLLNMLAGLVSPSRGEIRLAGRPMARLSRREVARSIAFVAQQAETGERICVRDAVELGRTPWLDALRPWGREDDDAVNAALEAVDMQHMARRDWATLSGGERQRVHIARAHAQKPQLLLLDEPTNHLDIHHQIGILDLIGTLAVTTVIALHDLNHAQRCDRLLVMKHGRCAALGPPHEVLTAPLIREIFAVEAELIPHPSGGRPVFAFQRLA